MKFILVLIALLVLSGCSRSAQENPAPPEPANATPEPDRKITLDLLCGILADETMPRREKVKLFSALDKAYIEWDCFLSSPESEGEFMLSPAKNAAGGIRMQPPKGYTAVIGSINSPTPLRVRGQLVFDSNGLHLEASSIVLKTPAPPNHSPEPAPKASH